MEDRRPELRALIELDEVHRDQAALILLYAQDAKNEDLLCIIRHVPFLAQSAWGTLAQRNPSEDEVKEAISVKAVRNEARKFLLSYPTQENLDLLLYGGDEVSEQAGEMLFRDRSQLPNQLLISIIRFTKGFRLGEEAATELLGRSNVTNEELERIIMKGVSASLTQSVCGRILRQSPTVQELLRLFRSDFLDRTLVWGFLSRVLSTLDEDSLWGLFKDFPENRPVVWEYLKVKWPIRSILSSIISNGHSYGEPYASEAARILQQKDPAVAAMYLR